MARFSGERVRKLRGRRTQIDLAAALRKKGFGTTQTQVSRWEAGQAPRAYILPALAAELGCEVADLFEESEEDSELPLHRDKAERAFSLLGEALGVQS